MTVPYALTILLIEDNEEHAKLISRYLARAAQVRVDLLRETTLKGGLERLAAGAVDAILLDLRLPDSELHKTLPKVLAASRNLPVVVLSSLEDTAFALETVHQGAQDYLCKAHLSSELLIRSILNAIERKRIEQALIEAKAEAEHANTAKDRFFAALSHELRTPLTPALMICSSLEENQNLDESVRSALGRVRRSLDVEVTLIDDLLDFTRVTRGTLNLKKECLNVHTAIQDVVDLFVLSEAREKGVRLDCALVATEHHVTGDGGRLHQVFSNLFKNALKFTPSGGQISVKTFNHEAGKVAIEVADSGIGIDAAVLPRLFSAFEQCNISSYCGGLGLGLTVSRNIIDAHQGTLSAASPGLNLGTTLRVELGTCLESSVKARTPVVDEETQVLRILLIEDHAMTRETLARLLTRHGHTVTSAGDVASAKSAAERDSFDLVISDLGLPDGDGRALMRYLKEQFHLPGIAFSGFGMEEDIVASCLAGFAEHLTKPVEWTSLCQAIQRTMRAAA